MKLGKLIIFSISLIFLILFSLDVLAEGYYYSNAQDFTREIVDAINSFTEWLFGTTFISTDIIIYLVVFAIIAIMFSDALVTFSPMSRKASIAVGILLAVVLALLNVIQWTIGYLLMATAVLGAFGMVASILFVFVAYFVFHFAILRLILTIWNPTAANIRTVKSGIKGLREIGEEFKKHK